MCKENIKVHTCKYKTIGNCTQAVSDTNNYVETKHKKTQWIYKIYMQNMTQWGRVSNEKIYETKGYYGHHVN